MTKQLTQEQIDSLNAIYVKMGDDSLELEFSHGNDWFPSNTPAQFKIDKILSDGVKYRIKPQAPKKKYYKVEGAELPVPLTKATYHGNSGNQVTCIIACSTEEEAQVWYDFLYEISDARNVILK